MKIYKYLLILLAFALSTQYVYSGMGELPLTNTTFLNDEERAQILTIPEPDERTARYYLDYQYDSPKNRFRVHYNLTGEHAVDPTDNDQNGIPDYVDSIAYYADYIYEVQVLQMGFIKPMSDDTLNGNDNYDIFLFDLGNPDQGNRYEYGHTKADADYGDYSGPWPRFSSILVMDNDYSPKDSAWVEVAPGDWRRYATWQYETGPTMAKTIIAHEYNHAIQMTYGYAVPRLLYEMTSTWMEWHIFPDVTDYHQHVNGLMKDTDKYPFGVGTDYAGYKWMIFGEYLDREIGYEVLVRMWEIFAEGNNIYLALDMALQEQSTSLVGEWCQFLSWTYFTGDKAKPGYLYDADVFREMIPYQTKVFSSPSAMSVGSLERFEVRLHRFIFPSEDENVVADTLDILLSSKDLAATINNQPGVRDYTITVANSYQEGFLKFGDNEYYFRIDGELDYICSWYFNSGGYTIENCDFVFPNPLKRNIQEEISFPSPPSCRVGEEVTLTIYDANLKPMYSQKKAVSAREKCKVVTWEDIPEKVGSGVYIYRVSNESDEKVGKFAVIK
jgi:hypothetical protein